MAGSVDIHADVDLPRYIPNAEVVDESADNLTMGLPTCSAAKIPAFLRELEGSQGIVKEWGIGNSTLEEVFLRLAAQNRTVRRIGNATPFASPMTMAYDITSESDHGHCDHQHMTHHSVPPSADVPLSCTHLTRSCCMRIRLGQVNATGPNSDMSGPRLCTMCVHRPAELVTLFTAGGISVQVDGVLCNACAGGEVDTPAGPPTHSAPITQTTTTPVEQQTVETKGVSHESSNSGGTANPLSSQPTQTGAPVPMGHALHPHPSGMPQMVHPHPSLQGPPPTTMGPGGYQQQQQPYGGMPPVADAANAVPLQFEAKITILGQIWAMVALRGRMELKQRKTNCCRACCVILALLATIGTGTLVGGGGGGDNNGLQLYHEPVLALLGGGGEWVRADSAMDCNQTWVQPLSDQAMGVAVPLAPELIRRVSHDAIASTLPFVSGSVVQAASHMLAALSDVSGLWSAQSDAGGASVASDVLEADDSSDNENQQYAIPVYYLTIVSLFVFPSVLSMMVYERAEKLHMLMMMESMNGWAYWVGNYVYMVILSCFMSGFFFTAWYVPLQPSGITNTMYPSTFPPYATTFHPIPFDQ